MQIDELVPPSSMSAYPVLQPDDPYVADLLQLADGRFAFFCHSSIVWLRLVVACLQYLTRLVVISICRINELQEDIINLKLDLEKAHECMKHLSTQVRKVNRRKMLW